MFFVVYILQNSRYVVVPHTWIKLNTFMERIVNNGIHSNVIFQVFYTQNPDAFENSVPLGIPRVDFAPNMHASSDSRFPNEGWFRCYIRRFKCMYLITRLNVWNKTNFVLIIIIFMCSLVNFEAASAYQERRRNFPPALYNYSPRWLRIKETQPNAGQNVSTFFHLHSPSGNLNAHLNKNSFIAFRPLKYINVI